MAKPPSILVVDDSIDALQTLSDILGAAGYAVRTAPSAERALQILEGAAVDLVITDLRMGGMGGMGLIRRLRESQPDLPLIALSGFADAGTIVQAFREGVVDFIAKPFTASEVLEAVTRALAQRPAARPMSAARGPAPGVSHALTPEQRARAEGILRELQGRLGAELVVLAGSGGALLAAQGLVDEPVAEAVAQGIGQVEALLEPLAEALGEPAFAAQAWEGERRALYAVRVGEGRFLVAVVPRSVKPGLVWLELREALSRLRALGTEPPGPSPEPPPPAAALDAEVLFAAWEEPPSPAEGELLSYEEARARGLIPGLEEGAEGVE
ncbi:response regulator [Thermoflexus sp.]|uniref:response regulator n=1 Tax=Thermoflexus sp. TaxID=1969742 RepID=UPI0035E43AC6